MRQFINKTLWACLLVSLFLGACNNKTNTDTSNSQQKQETPKNAVAGAFPMIEIPAYMSDPVQRADYLVEHYWDKFNFSDTTLCSRPDITEQGLSNYIQILYEVSPEKAAAGLHNMMSKATVDSAMYACFRNIVERYLYDPNSPMRNEDFYAYVLNYIIASPQLSEIEKYRPRHELSMIMKNRKGDVAADFTYTLASGKTGKLHQIKADYLLLMFYNPGCENCREVRSQINSSPLIQELEKNNRLTILAVYPDEDVDEWRKYIDQIPAHWINGYDATQILKNKEVYDLKAIPTLYLLDKNKKVLLKDAAFPLVEEYFNGNIQKD